MLILLSPAKDLAEPGSRRGTQPRSLDLSEALVTKLKALSPKALGKLMGISPELAQLNHGRYQAWSRPFTTRNARPAILTFNGEAYRGLNASTLDPNDLRFAQRHLRILSGLYGVLRPLDLIQPYRLEMGTSMAIGGRKDLYAFWSDEVQDLLRSDLRASGSKVLVDLASQEYTKVVRTEELGAKVVTPVFKDKGPKGYRMVMVYAKQQRGAMARFIIQSRLTDVEGIKRYTGNGYVYSKRESSEQQWVFLRG